MAVSMTREWIFFVREIIPMTKERFFLILKIIFTTREMVFMAKEIISMPKEMSDRVKEIVSMVMETTLMSKKREPNVRFEDRTGAMLNQGAGQMWGMKTGDAPSAEGGQTGRLELQKKLVGTHFQRAGNFKKNFNGGGALATFDPPDVIGMNVGLFRQGFLAQSGLHPVFENRRADGFALSFLEHQRHESRSRRKQPHTLRVEFNFLLALFFWG